MTIEGFDLKTNLRACRTYFLTKNVKNEHNVITINNDEDVPWEYSYNKEENVNYKDEEFVINLYLSIVVGFNEVM